MDGSGGYHWGLTTGAATNKCSIVLQSFCPFADDGASIDLYEVATSLKEGGLELPMLFRFPDIVGHRVAQLQACAYIRSPLRLLLLVRAQCCLQH